MQARFNLSLLDQKYINRFEVIMAVGIDFGNNSCYIAVARMGGIETIDNDYRYKMKLQKHYYKTRNMLVVQ